MHEQVAPLLSAFLDGELTQADAQRVRIHLEDCAECRQALHEMQTIGRAARTLEFPKPKDDEIARLEKALSVRAPRIAGWVLLLLGLLSWSGYAAWLFLTSPDLLSFESLVSAAIFIGFLLLLVSVIRQRFLELPHDRYRGVKK